MTRSTQEQRDIIHQAVIANQAALMVLGEIREGYAHRDAVQQAGAYLKETHRQLTKVSDAIAEQELAKAVDKAAPADVPGDQ